MSQDTVTTDIETTDLHAQALLDERIERWIWRLLAVAIAALGLALLLLPAPVYQAHASAITHNT